jgi:hypothetical protein
MLPDRLPSICRCDQRLYGGRLATAVPTVTIPGASSQLRTLVVCNRCATSLSTRQIFGPRLDANLSSDMPWEESSWQRQMRQALPRAGRSRKAS